MPKMDNKDPLYLKDFQMGKDYITVGHVHDEADQYRLRAFVSWARDEASRVSGWPRIPQFKKIFTVQSQVGRHPKLMSNVR